MSSPNVVFFFSDQQRWDTCGCYGQELPVTPNLDRMAAEGVRFEYAFTCQPVCGPARACLQTGKYATETRLLAQQHRPAAGRAHHRPLVHRVRATRPATSASGTWPPAPGPSATSATEPVPPERRGGYRDFWLASDVLEFTSHGYDGHMFDGDGTRYEFPAGRYRVDALTDCRAGVPAEPRRRDRPFFLFVSYIEPHHQNDHNHYEGPDGLAGAVRATTRCPATWSAPTATGARTTRTTSAAARAWTGRSGASAARWLRPGRWTNTLMIYTSDHGSHFRTRNAEYKRSCHDGCLRIPMVACGPGFARRRRGQRTSSA